MRKGFTSLFVICVLLILVLAGAVYYFNKSTGNSEVTTHIQISPLPSSEVDSGVEGYVMLGPKCPVEKSPPDPECAPSYVAATIEITNADTGKLVLKATSNSDGNFKINLPPGSYDIIPLPLQGIQFSKTDRVTVKAHEYVRLNLLLDTGIR